MDDVGLIPLIIATAAFGGLLAASIGLLVWVGRRDDRRQAVAAPSAGAVQPLTMAPMTVPRPAVAPPLAPATEQRMSLAQWLDLVQNRLDDAPHTMIVGVTGTGKTTLVKALCATRQGQVLFVSPKPNAWPGLTYPTIDDDGGFTAIECAMQGVLTELQQRLAAMKRGTDPATFTTLTIVVDEFPTIADECATAPLLFRKLGQIGRELRLRLIPLSTTRLVKDLGLEGRGAARDNFAEITLPRSTARVSGLLRLAADDEAQPIVLAGVLELSQQPIDPARWWTPSVQPVAEAATTVAGVAIAQTEIEPSLRNAVAQPVAAGESVDPLVAQHDWLTVARLIKAKAIGQTEVLKALGFPAGNGSNYLQARACLLAALKQLEPSTAPIADTTTQPLRAAQTA